MASKRIWLFGVVLSLMVVGVVWAALVIAAPGSQVQNAPLFLGSGDGTSSSGSTANTITAPALSPAAQAQGGGTRVTSNGRIDTVELPAGASPQYVPAPKAEEVYIDGPSALGEPEPSAPQPLITSFQGLTDSGDAFGFLHIPPDPIMAAGPNHLMGLVNTSFGIFTKSGTLQKRIDATFWFDNVLPAVGPCDRPAEALLGCVFDPKVDLFVKTPRQPGARWG